MGVRVFGWLAVTTSLSGPEINSGRQTTMSPLGEKGE